MGKPYVFNEIEYDSLNSLANAYAVNFNEGINDIYTNSKKLIKFIKNQTKDKELIKDIVSYLSLSKYKNNALTFIIFRLSGERKVVINGSELTLEEYIKALKENSNKEDNALFAFLEDYGISKTYAKQGIEPKLTKDSYYIERNFDLDFTYQYLTTYYDFEIVESLNAKISNIAINKEECFRRATKATSSLEFQLSIAHKIGFKEAVAMNKEINPLFYAVKLLKSINETEEESLRLLISDTFYWWLLDNYDKYMPVKKEAKDIFDKLKEIKKEYMKYQSQVEARKIVNISIDLYADMSRSLYLVYLKFINLYRKGLIEIKKKIGNQDFEFDKPYCKTYICQEFMNGRIVKLYNPKHDEDKEIRINPLTGEVILDEAEENNNSVDIDDVSLDNPDVDLDISLDETIKLDKQIKYMNKYKSFGAFSIFATITNLIIVVIILVLGLIFSGTNGALGDVAASVVSLLNNIGAIILFAVAELLTIIFAITLGSRVNKTYNNALDARFLATIGIKDNITPKQEAKYIKLSLNEATINKYAYRNHKIASLFVMVFAGVSFAILALFVGALISGFVPSLISQEALKQYIIYAIFGAVIGAVYGIIKKYKGFLSLAILFILVFGASIIVMIFM